MSSRSKHQFRPSMLEVFEDRITPTTVALPTQTLFIPGGHSGASSLISNGNYGVAPGTNGGFFTVSGDTVSTTITQNTGSSHYYMLLVYTAPGGGENPNSHSYDNLSSQTLVSQSAPFLLPNGGNTTFSVDLSQLKLTGQQKCQLDIIQFDAPDPKAASNFQAPKKAVDVATGVLVYGEIFDYDNPGGQTLQHGPGR